MNTQTALTPFLSHGVSFRIPIDFSVKPDEVLSQQCHSTPDFTIGVAESRYRATAGWMYYDVLSPVFDEDIIETFGSKLWFLNTHIFFIQLAQLIVLHRWDEESRLQSEHLNNLFFLVEPDGLKSIRRIHLLPEHREIYGSRAVIGGGGTPYPVGTRIFIPAF